MVNTRRNMLKSVCWHNCSCSISSITIEPVIIAHTSVLTTLLSHIDQLFGSAVQLSPCLHCKNGRQYSVNDVINNLFVISSAGWAFRVSWPNAVCVCVCVCVYICLHVYQGGTNHNNQCTQIFVILYAQSSTDLLINPDRMPKTRPIWPTLRVKITRRKSRRESAFLSHLCLTDHGVLVIYPVHVVWIGAY